MVDGRALPLAGLLLATGAVHLLRPGTFDAALPDQLPGSKRAWEVGSGLAELACAALLATPRTRRRGGYLTAALFVAVFPGNLHMVRTARTSRARLITLARLPLQVPLVWWAWRVARPGARAAR
ncbi:MAG: DoxX family protein [Propionibacteriaceae bacterium]